MKAVFFDLDGTLCNTLPDLTASLNYALRTFDDPTFSEDQVRMMIGNGIDRLIERALPRDAVHRTQVKGLFRAHYAAHCTDRTLPYPGMVKTISTLHERGLLLACITNKMHESAAKIVSALFPNNGSDFACVLGQTDSFPFKPDPAALLHVANQLDVTPDEILYVGDSDVDVRLAENAGTGFIGCAWGFRGRKFLIENGSGIVIDRPEELLDFINKGRN